MQNGELSIVAIHIELGHSCAGNEKTNRTVDADSAKANPLQRTGGNSAGRWLNHMSMSCMKHMQGQRDACKAKKLTALG